MVKYHEPQQEALYNTIAVRGCIRIVWRCVFIFVPNLAANGREESDDDVNIEDSYPSIPAANGFPIQQQLQALYSSRGQTTATTSKTVTSRYHPPVSLTMPTYSRYVKLDTG